MSDNLYLFANNNGGQAEGNGSYRLYDMKIEGDSEGVNSGVDYVEYLEGDGASWIDTGIIPDDNTQIEITCQLVEFKGYRSWFGSDNLCAGYQVQVSNLIAMMLGNGCAVGVGEQTGSYNKNIWKMDTSNTIVGTKRYIVSINGVDLINFNPTKIIQSTTSLKVFSADTNSISPIVTKNCAIKGKVFEFKLSKNNILKMHLRPCLDAKGVPCMYDEVSKKYFYNQGTGTFKYKKKLRDFQPVLDSNNIPCLLDKLNNKFYYNKGTGVFNTKEKVIKKLPFIKTDGASYINTKLKPTDITGGTVEIKCDTLDFGTTKFASIAVFGCGYGVSLGDSIDLGLKNHYNRQLMGFESTEITNDGNLVIHKGIGVNATREREIYVGAINGRNGAYYGNSSIDGFRISYFKIWNSEGALIQHLIPAIDENNNVGMYDEVTKTFFPNQGTGAFGYEIEELEVQDKNYTEIEYIESNGTQYIDTGVVPNSNTDIDMTSRLSAAPYYFSGYKNQINTPTQQISMVIEFDFKYANARGGMGNILGNDNLFILENGTYSLDGTTSTNVKASTTKYDKIKLILNLESKSKITYVNGVKIGETEYTYTKPRLSVGGSYVDYCSFYTHYVNAYRLSDMTPLFLLRPCLGKYTYGQDNFEYTIPKLKDTLTDTEYQTTYGDSLANKFMDYGYDSNYIYNKLKLINLSAVQNPSAAAQNKPQYDKTVYEYNGVATTVKPNLVASSGATLTMGSQNLEKLDDDDIETATNNGWSLV